MRPVYFGSAARQLLGIYYSAAVPKAKRSGVLLCYPAPQEYMASHWAVRKLAAAIAREGFEVFRFDYTGTGDSAGRSIDATLDTWRDDIRQAAEELRDLAEVRRVSVVGLRLGAALAAQAALRVRDLVLWDPVVLGAAHVDELRMIHERTFAHCLHPPVYEAGADHPELMGVPLARPVWEDMKGLDLCTSWSSNPSRVLLVASRAKPEHERLLASLAARSSAAGFSFERRLVPEGQTSAGNVFLLSSRAQRAIAAWLAGTEA